MRRAGPCLALVCCLGSLPGVHGPPGPGQQTVSVYFSEDGGRSWSHRKVTALPGSWTAGGPWLDRVVAAASEGLVRLAGRRLSRVARARGWRGGRRRIAVVDLARFDAALDGGALISAQSRARMMTPTRSADGQALPYGLGWFVQEYRGHTLVWHSGWWEDAYSALYLNIPAKDLTFIILANSEGVWWGNPLDRAAVERSDFAEAFLRAFVFD